MKTLTVNAEVYENLKTFINDPFEDTADTVLQRLMDIANKAKSQCSGFEIPEFTCEPPSGTDTVPKGTRIPKSADDSTVPL